MDVISLLNLSSSTHQQGLKADEDIRHYSSSCSPSTASQGTVSSRPRTHATEETKTRRIDGPAASSDSENYPLPLHSGPKALLDISQPPGTVDDDSQPHRRSGSPSSLGHQASNSRSSLSSTWTTTSSDSGSHSRFSSLSTINEYRSLSAFVSNFSPLDYDITHQGTIGQVVKGPFQEILIGEESRCKISGTGNGNRASIVLAVDHIQIPASPASLLSEKSPPPFSNQHHKPRTHPSLYLPISKKHKRAVSYPTGKHSSMSSMEYSHSTMDSTSEHNKSPDSGAVAQQAMMDTGSIPYPASNPPENLLTQQAIDFDDIAVAIRIAISVRSDATLTLLSNPGDNEFINKCLYRESCDTGSQLRKAVSHIFGRNKGCTRSIPPHVWVYYCRKHYQRSRYRNGVDYVRLQTELVQSQIKRVEAWSDGNKARGVQPVVVDWTLSIRKREQKRLDEKKATSRKRTRSDSSMDDEDDEEEDDLDDSAIINGTAVPDWLLARCGTGYSANEIICIWQTLKSDIQNGTLSQIPDIEILPNVVGTVKSDNKNKVARVRGESSGIHRRSQSVNNTHSGNPLSGRGPLSHGRFGVARHGMSLSSPSNMISVRNQGSPAAAYAARPRYESQNDLRPAFPASSQPEFRPSFGNAYEYQFQNGYSNPPGQMAERSYANSPAQRLVTAPPGSFPQQTGPLLPPIRQQFSNNNGYETPYRGQLHQQARSGFVAPGTYPYPAGTQGYQNTSAYGGYNQNAPAGQIPSPASSFGHAYRPSTSPVYGLSGAPSTVPVAFSPGNGNPSYGYEPQEGYFPRQPGMSASEHSVPVPSNNASTQRRARSNQNASSTATYPVLPTPVTRNQPRSNVVARISGIYRTSDNPNRARSNRIIEDEKTKALYSERRG